MSMSRQNIYLLALSVFLLIFVLVFSFSLLIPKGKEYRNNRVDLKKEKRELRKYENFRDDILERLNELKTNNKSTILAFDRNFDRERFLNMNKSYFTSLDVSEKVELESENAFMVYEVNTTSEINSPKSFYDFLDSVNKSDWVISVNLPIHFKREKDLIRSSFTMKVYSAYTSKELKPTKE